MKKLFFILIIAQLWGCIQKINYDETLESLVEEERSFSKTLMEQGIRDAFLTYLAEDTMVFRPNPVKAKPLYEKQQQSPGKLSCKPMASEVSKSGDLGYAYGTADLTSENVEKNCIAI